MTYYGRRDVSRLSPTKRIQRFLRRAQPTFVWNAATDTFQANPGGTMTTAGNEITDALRALRVQGDGLLNDSSYGIWEASRNECPNGNLTSNLTGFVDRSSGVGTRLTGLTDSKFGTTSLQVVTAANTVNSGTNFPLSADAVAVSGDVWTASVWLRAGDVASIGKTARIVISEVSSAGSTLVESAGTLVLTAEWQRASVTRTFNNASTARLKGAVASADGTTPSFTIQASGMQYEKQPLPTPYIETNGAAASRAAADARFPSSVLTPNQGWVAMRVRFGWSNSNEPLAGAGFPVFFDWRETDGDPRLTVIYNESANTIFSQKFAGGVSQTRSVNLALAATGETHTVIVSWTASTLSVSVDGSAFSTNAAANNDLSGLAAQTPVTVGNNRSVSDAPINHLDGDVLWVAAGKGTLTDQDAALINSKWVTNPRSADINF